MPQRKRSSIRKGKTQPPGAKFELAVARIQQMLDPTSTVTHNEVLEDRVGNRRQFDVVIRGHFGGRKILGVIECKDHGRRKGPTDIEAFAKKCENVNANVRVFVSRNGFTPQALRLAKHENIACLSLFPSEPSLTGLSVGETWFGKLSRWSTFQLTVHFDTSPAPLQAFDLLSVLWNGKPVVNWFAREFLTKHQNEEQEGEFTLQLVFDETRHLEIEGSTYPVIGLSCTSTRVHQNKKTWVSWSGDAIFDWHDATFTIPDKGQIVSSTIDTEISTWDDFDGEFPAVTTGVKFIRGTVFQVQKWDHDRDIEVPDLTAL